MSRPRWQLRDAAVGYAARGIPVLPLHYPLPHRGGLQPLPGDPQPTAERGSCSCRDPGCGQVAKHPLGALVPHGVKDANLYNLVAAGALDQREVDQGLLAAAERCGLLSDEPRQTRRTLASGRQVGLAHPRHPPPNRAEVSPVAPLRTVTEAAKERG